MQQKTFNQIVQNMINNIHDTLPDVDSKPGTWLRDVIIDPVSDEFGALYAQMKLMEMQQSVLTAVGDDLDKLAGNYFLTRRSATRSYGKIRFYIDNRDISLLPDEILIPKGTVISTIPTIVRQSIQVQTTDSFYGNKNRISLLPIDANYPYYVYIELPAESVTFGSENNVGTGEFSRQTNNINPYVSFVRNPFAFTNGTDYEDDASLALRINLAISGANIGTKNGYLSYILKQDGVVDAKIVGAGDEMMRRDGGYIEYDKYITGSGGMVDIYIRGEQNSEELYNYFIDDYYVSTSNPGQFGDIVLPVQPVSDIVDISIVDPENPLNVVHLINAADYELETRTRFLPDLSIEKTKKYYKDVLWDFSITNDFQQELYDLAIISNDGGLPSKSFIDQELNAWLLLMSNVNYSLDWGDAYMVEHHDEANNFSPYYYSDNNIYMIKGIGAFSGLICVKRNDKLYIRIYLNPQPHYELIKDDFLQKGSSIYAQDRIHWLDQYSWRSGISSSILNSNYNLAITYNANELITILQNGIEQQRVLTADVLIKQAEPLLVEIILNVTCFATEDPNTIKASVVNNVTSYVETLKKLGGEFDVSDIIAVTKQVKGVDAVELDGDLKPEIREVSQESTFKITANGYQYFKIKNIVVNVQKNDIIQ